jgi:hypothetical protein
MDLKSVKKDESMLKKYIFFKEVAEFVCFFLCNGTVSTAKVIQ